MKNVFVSRHRITVSIICFYYYLLVSVSSRENGLFYSSRAFLVDSRTVGLLRGGARRQSPTWTFDHSCTSMSWTPLVSTRVSVAKDSSAAELSKPREVQEKDNDDSHLVVVGVVQSKDETKENKKENGKASKVELCGTRFMDKELYRFLNKTLLEGSKDFSAKLGSTCGGDKAIRMLATRQDGSTETRRVIMIGLGQEPDTKEAGRKFAKTLATLLKSEKGLKTCKVMLPQSSKSTDFCFEFSASLLSELYSDHRFKSKPKESDLAESVTLTFEDEAKNQQDIDKLQQALDRGAMLARGVYMAKDIVNCPHNTLNSHSLAETARRIAASSGGVLTCKILEQHDCEKRGMGAYLGVARGSETKPKFIHLVYRPRSRFIWKRNLRKLGIVGKGLLMDTGGYNIKTSMMELMKFDCGGAAAVLGAAMAIAALRPKGVEAHFVVAACENMINERAVVPGDILTASNGKTIEVINTDAEGRLTMADALVYVDKELNCEEIIELSTLTGACMMALGSAMAGLFTDNDDLAAVLEQAAESTGDKIWRLPMEKEYNDQIKSKIADLRNLGGRYPGAITEALFLQNFVEKDKPFAHIDMAGPVWSTKHGATGYGVKLVTEWVCRQETEIESN